LLKTVYTIFHYLGQELLKKDCFMPAIDFKGAFMTFLKLIAKIFKNYLKQHLSQYFTITLHNILITNKSALVGTNGKFET